MPFQRSEKQKKIRIKNSIEIESRIRLPCVRAGPRYGICFAADKDGNSVNPIGLYRATFAAIGRRALLNCHWRPRFRGRPVIRGQTGWLGWVGVGGETRSLAIDLWVVFGVPLARDFEWIECWNFILSMLSWLFDFEILHVWIFMHLFWSEINSHFSLEIVSI